MKNFILGLAGGYILARYLIFSMDRDEYMKREAETIDNLKNKLHDLLEQVTDLSQKEIVEKVEETVNTGEPVNQPLIADES